MAENTFLNLVRGNTLGSYLHLSMNEGVAFRYGGDYTYVEVPVAEFYNTTEEKVVDKASRSQKLKIIPACTVGVRNGYKILVRTNPKLQEVANCPALFLIEPGEVGPPSFYASFQRDFDATNLDWAVRLYLLG